MNVIKVCCVDVEDSDIFMSKLAVILSEVRPACLF